MLHCPGLKAALKVIGIVILVGSAWGVLAAKTARGQSQEYPNCEGWISSSCCCTNDCCFVVEPGTVEAVDQDHYRIVASGQVIKRTGWSQNGRFMRCACDHIDGKWTIHPTAETRCIYPPMPSS